MIRRPGPDRIEAREARGGLVLRGYSVPDERLIFETRVTGDDAESKALADAEEVERLGIRRVCLVVYDGDSGERMTFGFPMMVDLLDSPFYLSSE